MTTMYAILSELFTGRIDTEYQGDAQQRQQRFALEQREVPAMVESSGAAQVSAMRSFFWVVT